MLMQVQPLHNVAVHLDIRLVEALVHILGAIGVLGSGLTLVRVGPDTHTQCYWVLGLEPTRMPPPIVGIHVQVLLPRHDVGLKVGAILGSCDQGLLDS